jgi:hypothetical protein
MSKKKLKPGKFISKAGDFSSHEKYIINKILSGDSMDTEEIYGILSRKYPPNKLMGALESLMSKIEKIRMESESE